MAEPQSDLYVLQATLKPPVEAGGDHRADLWLIRGRSPNILDTIGLADDCPVKLEPERLLAMLPEIDEHGKALSEGFFFSEKLRTAWKSARDRAGRWPLRIQLQLAPQVEALHAVPWESLREPRDDGSFDALRTPLALVRERGFVRRIEPLDGNEYEGAIHERPQRLLALIADPLDLERRNLEPIKAPAIATALQPLRENAGLALSLLGHRLAAAQPASLDQLVGKIERGADIICLFCHGGSADEGTRLYLENTAGETVVVSGHELVNALTGVMKPQLVVLAVCQSGGRPYERNGFLTALGPEIARRGVGAVVCMQGEVSIEGMTRFVPRLIGEVLAGSAVDEAVVVARAEVRQLRTADGDDRDDWWRPVLFMQPRDGRLWGGATRFTSPALQPYLAAVRDRCDRLPADTQELATFAPPLHRVYVDLSLKPRSTLPGGGDLVNPREFLVSRRWIVLEGDAGSGKQALVNYVAYGFSQWCLARLRSESDQAARELLGPCAELGSLVPVIVDLPDLNASLASSQSNGAPSPAPVERLWAFLEQQHGAELAGTLKDYAQAHGLFWIFTDLEAVEGHGPPVIELLRQLPSALSRQCSGVVTTGPGAHANEVLKSADWHGARLEPLSDRQQLDLAERWFASLEAEDGSGPRKLDRQSLDHRNGALRQDLRTSPGLADFGRSPRSFMRLLLTYTCEAAVLRQRTSLSPILDAMVGRFLEPELGNTEQSWWEENPGAYRSFLARLAESLTWKKDAEATLASIDEFELRTLIARYLRPISAALSNTPPELPQLSSDGSPFLQSAESREADTKAYRFRLASLQWFLAAEALYDSSLDLGYEAEVPRDFVSRGLRRAEAGAQWHEALLFAAAGLARLQRAREAGYLAEELLQRARASGDARLVRLASGLLVEAGKPEGDALRERPGQVWRAAARRLGRQIARGDKQWRSLELDSRVQAGRLLAQLGDERPGVTGDFPAWSAWFPAGEYQLGPGLAPANLSSFCIARFPITEAQFARFRDDEGYTNQEWWTIDLREFPFYSINSDPDSTAYRGRLLNEPATSLNLYEAEAYCRWLTAKARSQGWIGEHDQIRLPTESEWVAAALCTPEGQRWRRWNNEQQQLLRQLLDVAAPRPFSVGLFPELATGAGIYDAVGNIAEWCATACAAGDDYLSGDSIPDDADHESLFVIRGSTGSDLLEQPWAARTRVQPDYLTYELGFRVVWTRPG